MSFRAGCPALSTLLLSWERMPSSVGSAEVNLLQIFVFISLVLERGEGRERERDRNIDVREKH